MDHYQFVRSRDRLSGRLLLGREREPVTFCLHLPVFTGHQSTRGKGIGELLIRGKHLVARVVPDTLDVHACIEERDAALHGRVDSCLTQLCYALAADQVRLREPAIYCRLHVCQRPRRPAFAKVFKRTGAHNLSGDLCSGLTVQGAIYVLRGDFADSTSEPLGGEVTLGRFCGAILRPSIGIPRLPLARPRLLAWVSNAPFSLKRFTVHRDLIPPR